MRAVMSSLVIAGAALLVSACGGKETRNVASATEIQVENETTSDAMVISINAALPIDNLAEPAPANATATNATAANATANASTNAH